MRRTTRIFCAVGIIVAATFGVLHLPIISVRSVTIDSASDIDSTLRDEILVYAEGVMRERVYGVPGKTRYFFYKDDFEKMLRERFLRARGITIESHFFNIWRITANRRYSFGTHCTDARCIVVGKDGFVFMETDIQVGNALSISDSMGVGEYVFGADAAAITDFKKVPEAIVFLERGGMPVKQVSLRRDTRVVYVELVNGIGIWLDASEALYDTTRALHIVFEEVFSDPKKQAAIVSVDVRNPLSILYEQR